MLPRLDFGHFYKFVASAGIVLLVSSFVVPWLFTQSVTVLAIPAADIERMTTVAQLVIAQRQRGLAWIQQNLLLGASAFFFSSGVGLLVWGVLRWRSRQLVSDEGEDYEVSTKRAEFEAVPPRQVEEKREAEIQEEPSGSGQRESRDPVQGGGETEGGETPRSETPFPGMRRADPNRAALDHERNRRTRIEQLDHYEGLLAAKVRESFSNEFSVNENVRLISRESTDKMVFDLLLEPLGGAPWGQFAIDLKMAPSMTRVGSGSRIFEGEMALTRGVDSRGVH